MEKKQALIYFLMFLLGLGGGYLFSGRVLTRTVEVPQKDIPEIKLPSDAEKISECIPGQGFHWARPQDLPHGPLYNLYNDEVVATEYMYQPEELKTDIPSEGLDLFGYEYEFMTLSFLPQGHEGYKVPHYDFHYYTKPIEEIKKTTCPGSPYEGLVPIPGVDFVPPEAPKE